VVGAPEELTLHAFGRDDDRKADPAVVDDPPRRTRVLAPTGSVCAHEK
jgi:hypothetical protein